MRSKAFVASGLALAIITGIAWADDDRDVDTQPGRDASLPASIQEIMDQPRYKDATWSLLVVDVDTGETFYSLNPDEMSLTGSTRKLFSVGMALESLGADHRVKTPVHRMGKVNAVGELDGNLVLVGAGDLTFGGRRIDANTVQYTDFDHNDANNLGTAILTPQDPLFALDELARQVRASGITSVSGDVVIDDRLFDTYRVPNGNLLITPVLLNENMVDVRATPTEAGRPAAVEHRPATAAFDVESTVETTAVGTEASLELSGNGRIQCLGSPACSGTVAGNIPVDYRAPLSGDGSFVGTFRVEDPNAFMRTAFIEALRRHSVAVAAPAVAENPTELLPPKAAYPRRTRVARFVSPPYAQDARLILKVSLNLGANLSLSLLGLEEGATTVADALAVEREILIENFGIDGAQFDFPTNGSGTPDSRAAPRALVDLLIAMHGTDVADVYKTALPIMGVDGSLATTGLDLSGRGRVFAKPGTTIAPGEDGETLELKAQNLAGYIESKGGRTLAYVLMVNDAGVVQEIETDVSAVITDEARISNIIYETL